MTKAPIPFRMYLPMSGGNIRVFCEMSFRKTRPCDGFIVYDVDGKHYSGYVIYPSHGAQPVAICSETCLIAYARRKN